MSANDLFAILVMAGILVGIGVFVSAPLLRARGGDLWHDEYAETPLHHLLSRKDSIYTAMKDLEFDYSTGKLSDDDYKDLQAKFTEQAAEILKEIDELTGAKRPSRAAIKAKAQDSCRACGFKVEPGDKFCQSCGTAIGLV